MKEEQFKVCAKVLYHLYIGLVVEYRNKDEDASRDAIMRLLNAFTDYGLLDCQTELSRPMPNPLGTQIGQAPERFFGSITADRKV
jgi:hypothetical protein